MAKPNPLAEAQDLQKMLVSYAKQETIEPLKSLGNFLKFGVSGAIMLFLGAFFIGLGVLRLLQSELTWFDSQSWSWVPYLATIVVLSLLMAILVWGFLRAKKAVA